MGLGNVRKQVGAMQLEGSNASYGSWPVEEIPHVHAPASTLVVSNASVNTTGLKVFLKTQGYTVLSAVSAKDALEKTRRFLPTFILLNRDMDGAEVCVLFPELLIEHSGAAVIMMAAKPRIWEVVEAIKLGTVDYLGWPPDLKRLKSALDIQGDLFPGR